MKKIICRDWLCDMQARELAAHKAQIKEDIKWILLKLFFAAQYAIVGVAIGILIGLK